MELSPQGIPILDFSPAINGHSGAQLTNLANHLAHACETIGCFYIKNHGVAEGLIDNIRSDIRSFFAQPFEYKSKHVRTDNGWMGNGYYPFQSLNTHAYMGEKDLPNDQLETFAFGPVEHEYPFSDNIYPDYPPTFKANFLKYFESLTSLGLTVMRVLSIAANAPDEDYFVRKCMDGPHATIFNYFPSHSKRDPKHDNWMPTHIDLSPLAIVALDPGCPKSLRAKNADGEWVFADHIPGTFFSNLGTTLQRWTNDKWVATEHGVGWPENGVHHDRLSVAYFVSVHQDALIECLPSTGKAKYQPITYKELVTKPLDVLRMLKYPE